MKAGVFSCDNGLGHVRRAVIIANELSQFLNVFLMGPPGAPGVNYPRGAQGKK